MGVLLLILYLALITPVKLGAAVSAEGGPPEALVGVMIWGWRRVARLRVRRRDGALRLCAEYRGKCVILGRGAPGGWSGKAAKALLRGLAGRGRRGRALRLCALEGFIRVGGRDAAETALLAGGLRAALAALPWTRFRCVPAFGGPTVLRLRCIARARLGTILSAGLLTAHSARRADRKEEKAWIIPSGSSCAPR